jgi:hypothetical protein
MSVTNREATISAGMDRAQELNCVGGSGGRADGVGGGAGTGGALFIHPSGSLSAVAELIRQPGFPSNMLVQVSARQPIMPWYVTAAV